MGIADDMKRLAKEVVSSYESRISEVAIIVDNTHCIAYRSSQSLFNGYI